MALTPTYLSRLCTMILHPQSQCSAQVDFLRRYSFSAFIHRLKKRQYHLVSPGRVSPVRPVPPHIVKPAYAVEGADTVPPPLEPEIKTGVQIEGMRKACALAASLLKLTTDHVKVGVTTDEIDGVIHEECIARGAYPSPLLYRGFPKSVCTSVNNVACHGIPDDRKLRDGDIVNVDITVYLEGYHGDTSTTFLVGEVDASGRRLVEVAERCRDVGVEVCRPGTQIRDIGRAISKFAETEGYTVIPDFCGHGIGNYFHGPPDIIHIDYPYKGTMQPGMTFTIEPIISEGHNVIKILGDRWTAVSVDHSRSAQFEHTVLITETGVEVLTRES